MKKSLRLFTNPYILVTLILSVTMLGCPGIAYLMGGTMQGLPLTMVDNYGVVTTLAGDASVESDTVDGIGAAARFNEAYGITTDGVSLFVSEKDGNAIRKINKETGEVTTLASGYGFGELTGLTCDGTNLYVCERYTNSILQIVISTEAVTTVAGNGSTGLVDGIANAEFNNPYGITHLDGILYIADRKNHAIRKVVIATGDVTTIAGNGDSGSADGIGSVARFYNPRGLTTDGYYLYITDWDNYTIRRLDLVTNEVTTIAGSAGNYGSRDGIGTASRFYCPRGIITDGTNLFITDYWNNTIRKMNLFSGKVTTIAGTGTEYGESVDGIGTSVAFNFPTGLTSDGCSLFVTERGTYYESYGLDSSTVREIR